jgi:hypothetical protein
MNDVTVELTARETVEPRNLFFSSVSFTRNRERFFVLPVGPASNYASCVVVSRQEFQREVEFLRFSGRADPDGDQTAYLLE